MWSSISDKCPGQELELRARETTQGCEDSWRAGRTGCPLSGCSSTRARHSEMNHSPEMQKTMQFTWWKEEKLLSVTKYKQTTCSLGGLTAVYSLRLGEYSVCAYPASVLSDTCCWPAQRGCSDLDGSLLPSCLSPCLPESLLVEGFAQRFVSDFSAKYM